MDQILALTAVGGLGGAAVRAGVGLRDMFATPSRVRGWPPSRKAVVPLPYVDDPKRKKEARRRRPIDAAANMRALNAGPPLRSPGQVGGENPAIAANLAKTRANRAMPGYAASYTQTNYEPYGQPPRGTPLSPPASLSPHAPAEAIGGRHSAGLAAVAASQQAARPSPLTGPRPPQDLPAPPGVAARRPAQMAGRPPASPPPRAAGGPGVTLGGLAGSAIGGLAGSALGGLLRPGGAGVVAPPQSATASRKPGMPAAPGPLAGLMQPPGGRGITPVGDLAARSGPAAGVKAAATPVEPSTAAKAMTSLAGLARDGRAPSAVRDYLNPSDATSLAGMPWAYAALPLGALGGAAAGWGLTDAIAAKHDESDGKAEVAEAKGRYEEALRRRVLAKRAGEEADPLDELAELRVKDAALTSIPLGLLLATGAIAGVGGAVAGRRMGGESSRAMLERAVRERQVEILQGPNRPIEIRPESIPTKPGEDDEN